MFFEILTGYPRPGDQEQVGIAIAEVGGAIVEASGVDTD
jgi:hypothetical protein